MDKATLQKLLVLIGKCEGGPDAAEAEAIIVDELLKSDPIEALRKCENFIANTESELGVTLECGKLARAALARTP